MKALINVVFIDIETVSSTEHLEELPVEAQELWTKKAAKVRNIDIQEPELLYKERAAIYAEFGKVVSISLGYCYTDEANQLNLRVKSLYHDDEATLLNEFCDLISQKFDLKKVRLCAHNGKEFDFPYLSRRMVVNGIRLPFFLDLAGKKPWEVKHLDTMEMWKFGDRKSYTSLELLTNTLGLSSPKAAAEMDGSMVGKAYYEEDDLSKIGAYCAEDVVATVQVYLRFIGVNPIAPENIHILV